MGSPAAPRGSSADWAFDDLGLVRIGLHAEVENVGSQRVAQHAGFRRLDGPPAERELKGVMRPVLLFERTKN